MKTISFSKLREQMRVYGRTLLTDNDGMAFPFSYSGFTLHVTGEEFTLFSEPYTGDMPAYFTVEIDGLTEKIAVFSEKAEHRFSLCAGEHLITVRLASSCGGSPPAVLSAIGVADTATFLEPPAEKPFKMEFLGDSITCGFGILSAPSESYETRTEDATINYAAQIAKAFDADARFIAYSGQGIVHNCAGQVGVTIPSLFRSAQRHTTDIPWNFDDGFVPHVVVINAATNDVGGKTTDEEMYAGATAFLKDIRKQYPAAKIVWTYGLMNTEFVPILQKAVDDLRATDPNVWFLPSEPIWHFQGQTGAVGHPGILGHRRAANELITFIKGII